MKWVDRVEVGRLCRPLLVEARSEGSELVGYQNSVDLRSEFMRRNSYIYSGVLARHRKVVKQGDSDPL
jgi:hypothetical protein